MIPQQIYIPNNTVQVISQPQPQFQQLQNLPPQNQSSQIQQIQNQPLTRVLSNKPPLQSITINSNTTQSQQQANVTINPHLNSKITNVNPIYENRSVILNPNI